VAGLLWNQWQLWRGTGGSFGVESVAGFAWNRWQLWRGIRILKQESIVVEIKMTRNGLGSKELSTQLIEDIERYKVHPDCQTLICFVYDPTGLIPNPRGIEADLNRDADPFPVRVLIRP
jgi:hypothetical protein